MLHAIKKLITLFRVLATNPVNGKLNKYKNFPIDNIKPLRMRAPWLFKMVCWAVSLSKDRSHHTPATGYRVRVTSDTVTHSDSVDLYLKDICSTIAEWNIFINIDDSIDIHEASVVTTYNVDKSRYPDLNSALLHTARLAYGMRNMCVSTNDDFYIGHYARLLDGIDRSLLRTNSRHEIICHPIINRLTPTEPPGICSIAALLLLISGFKKVDQSLVKHLEESVLDRFIDIMEYNDLIITSSVNTLPNCDLRPNALYNTTKCFIHVGIKILQRNLEPGDLKILTSFLDMRTTIKCNVANRSVEVIIDAATALEAILNLYIVSPGINRSPVLNISTFIFKSIDWLTHYHNLLPVSNPELESIMFRFCDSTPDTGHTGKLISSILRKINPLYNKRILVVTDTPNISAVSQDTFVGVLKSNDRLDASNTARYRRVVDVNPSGHILTHPVFEYLMIYSRVHSFVANRLTKGVRSE